MNTTNKAGAAVKTAMGWTEEKFATASALYTEQLEQDALTANSEAFLQGIAETVGVASARSVRSKLAREKVYKVSEQQPKKGKAAKVGKVQVVAQIEKALQLEAGRLDTLEKSNSSALETLLNALSK